ncbi:helix-turn-helix transcriptional regulator [Marinilactibacillus psychrotolerans]|uniref:Helix-turn-helix transcriptional regulator n=1 Tax=Marinilactibacillus psychrotolerans TaxID=191770 RepID=A0A5R9C626_9LACT|nr:helix-turn-helix domain-containing protein [Marinilactibacillus psychrotolerans]TLQ08512.1 helix-turn-helix transcriptional regulator [Marinilactibacillus psychrotolerans]
MWNEIEKQLNIKGWSVYKLTKKACLSSNLLYELKSGRTKDVGFINMCKIADALEISLDEFKPKKGR